MKKSTRHQHHVGTSQSNLRPKPYGFCCDVKEYDPTLDTKNGLGSLFSRHNLTGEGPNIKFRCQEINTVSTSLQRVNQRAVHRSGSRGRQRGRQRGGYDDAFRGGQRNGQRIGQRSGQRYGDTDNSREQLICERCRGPIKWYLEDEISAARDIMMQERRKKHSAQTEYNIKIAKKKGIKQNVQ